MKQRTVKLRQAGILTTAALILAIGVLFSGGTSAQEVLPTPPAPFKG